MFEFCIPKNTPIAALAEPVGLVLKESVYLTTFLCLTNFTPHQPSKSLCVY
jgi:hypothetical protein